jgi:hypothetical protein
MGTNMITKAAMETEMKGEVVMGKRENMVTGMMIEIVVMAIVILETLKTDMEEMVTRMTNTVEGAEVLIITMDQEVGARTGNGLLRMMANPHRGIVVRQLMIILKMGGNFQRRVLILEGSLFLLFVLSIMEKMSILISYF